METLLYQKYKADFIKRWDELKDFCEKAEPVQGKIIKTC